MGGPPMVQPAQWLIRPWLRKVSHDDDDDDDDIDGNDHRRLWSYDFNWLEMYAH